MTNTGGPAFPCETIHPCGSHEQVDGLSIRDYFAAKALIAWYCKLEDGVSNHPDSVAIWCYQLADAMLKERQK